MNKISFLRKQKLVILIYFEINYLCWIFLERGLCDDSDSFNKTDILRLKFLSDLSYYRWGNMSSSAVAILFEGLGDGRGWSD